MLKAATDVPLELFVDPVGAPPGLVVPVAERSLGGEEGTGAAGIARSQLLARPITTGVTATTGTAGTITGGSGTMETSGMSASWRLSASLSTLWLTTTIRW